MDVQMVRYCMDWLVETDQEQYVFFFLKEQYFDLRSMLNVQ